MGSHRTVEIYAEYDPTSLMVDTEAKMETINLIPPSQPLLVAVGSAINDH